MEFAATTGQRGYKGLGYRTASLHEDMVAALYHFHCFVGRNKSVVFIQWAQGVGLCGTIAFAGIGIAGVDEIMHPIVAVKLIVPIVHIVAYKREFEFYNNLIINEFQSGYINIELFVFRAISAIHPQSLCLHNSFGQCLNYLQNTR